MIKQVQDMDADFIRKADKIEITISDPKPKHTPTPWKQTSYKGWDAVIEANGNIPVLQLVENNPENASFIVHACNNIERVTAERDALFAACKWIAEHPLPMTNQEISDFIIKARLYARTEIASVEGSK